MAQNFARKNGVQHLLTLKEVSSFPGSLPLASLLLRHIVEDTETMKNAVHRAVSLAANSGVPNMFCGVGQNALGTKEVHYLLRALGPIACRNSELYTDSSKKIMRITTNSWRGQVDKSLPPNLPQIVKVPQDMKTIGLNGNVKPTTVIEDFVHILLTTLVERFALEQTLKASNTASANNTNPKTQKQQKQPAAGKKENSQWKTSTESHLPSTRTPQLTLVRRLTGEHIDEDEMTVCKYHLGSL